MPVEVIVVLEVAPTATAVIVKVVEEEYCVLVVAAVVAGVVFADITVNNAKVKL